VQRNWAVYRGRGGCRQVVLAACRDSRLRAISCLASSDHPDGQRQILPRREGKVPNSARSFLANRLSPAPRLYRQGIRGGRSARDAKPWPKPSAKGGPQYKVTPRPNRPQLQLQLRPRRPHRNQNEKLSAAPQQRNSPRSLADELAQLILDVTVVVEIAGSFIILPSILQCDTMPPRVCLLAMLKHQIA
jgi:hypothetical protein